MMFLIIGYDIEYQRSMKANIHEIEAASTMMDGNAPPNVEVVDIMDVVIIRGVSPSFSYDIDPFIIDFMISCIHGIIP